MLAHQNKRCDLTMTTGRWSWKLKSAQECVTTHLSSQAALKMDDAEAGYRYQTIVANAMLR